jgi:23S rRNA A2030 N6-methylase RlmJ
VFAVNPPFGFAEGMGAALAAMTAMLAQGEGAASSLEWRAGEA